MIVEILFFILIILIVILFLCVKKVYTGGFLPIPAGLPAGNPDDNSIVFFEMSSMTDINKYIDIVTYKNLINEYSVYDSNLLNDREKAEATEIDLFGDHDRQYKTIRDWFTIGDDLKYECHNDFKWGNSAFSFICGKSRTDYVGSVKQNLKEIINDYATIKSEITKDIHPPACDDTTKCIYCLTKDTSMRYLIYLYDAYRNSNIYPNLIKIIKDEFTKLQKYIRDILFDINKSNIITLNGNTFVNQVTIDVAGLIVNGNNDNCLILSYVIIMFYLCKDNIMDLNKLNIYYKFFRHIDNSLKPDDMKDKIKDMYEKLFRSISRYFQLDKYINPLTPYQIFINGIIDKYDIIIKAYDKINKYYDIVNKISVIICYNLYKSNISDTLLNVVEVNDGDVEINNRRKADINGKLNYDDNHIHKYIMYILFLIAKNTLINDINGVNNIIIHNKRLDDIINDSPACDSDPGSNDNYLYKNNILNVNNNITKNPTNKYIVISDDINCIWKGPQPNPLPETGNGYGYGRGQGRGLGPGPVRGRGRGRGTCIIKGRGKYRRVLYQPLTCALTKPEQDDLDEFIKYHAMKIAKILEPHINKAIKYFEADDRLILLEGTPAKPKYGFHAIQKAYYNEHIKTFYFMRQSLIIYPESFFGTNSDNKFNMEKVGRYNKFTVNCNSYDRYRVKNTQTNSKKYDLDIFYYTKLPPNNDPTDDDKNIFKLSLATEKPINSNIMTLPFIPIIYNAINIDEKITDDDRKYEIDKYYDMDQPFLGRSSSNIIRFICEHNINFVLYVGFGKGEFHLPNNINTNMIKMFGKNLGMPIEEIKDIEKIKEVLQDDIEIYTRLFNRLFSIIPRFFRAITTNAYYVKNEYSNDTIDNFIRSINPAVQGDMILKGDNIKIIDDNGIIDDGTNVTITMNILGTPENFTIENYNILLNEHEYDKLPSNYLITPHQGHNATIIKKLKVTKENDGPIIDKFTYIGTNMPIGDEIIERKKREPKQIYGGPQTSEFSLLAQIPQQKSTPMEYSLYYSTEEYKESEKDFSYSVQEFNLSSSSEYISSPATNESEYAICYTNNDYSSEKEMQSLCDSTGILYSTKLFAVESSEPVDDYERIRISQELHKLDNNIPEIKMPKDLKILKHDISKKNKIRIKKVIRGLNGKVLSIDDVHTIYINIE